jgi:hypothetical protein
MRRQLPLKDFIKHLNQKTESGIVNIGQRMSEKELEDATKQVFQQVAFMVFSNQKDEIPESQEREVVKFLIEKGFKADEKSPNLQIMLFFVVRCLLMRYGN